MEFCSDLDLDLVPGLPNELVALRILPLLPWYARPVCRAISTSWKSLIDAARHDPVLIDATRAAQIPLLRGALVLGFISNRGTVFKLVDRFHNRDLPLVQRWNFPPDGTLLVAGSGRIFVWIGCSQKRLFKLDVGRGDWHWQRVTTPIVSQSLFDPIVLGSKVYAPCHSPKLDVAVIDMESDELEKIPMWDCWDAGSLVSPLGVEDLYGFRDGDAGLVEVVRYDRSSNSWSTQERMTSTPPSWVRSSSRVKRRVMGWMTPAPMRSFMVVNGSCFEPSIETGINVLCCDFCNRQLWWHNSTVCEWIQIEWDDGISIHVIRGTLCGRNMYRSTLCKGKIFVESKRKHVTWEPLVYVPDFLFHHHGIALIY